MQYTDHQITMMNSMISLPQLTPQMDASFKSNTLEKLSRTVGNCDLSSLSFMSLDYSMTMFSPHFVYRTCLGIRAKDGIVLACEKLVPSKLLVPGSNRRIMTVDEHVGFVSAGLLADARHLVNRSRDEAENYLDTFRTPIPGKVNHALVIR